MVRNATNRSTRRGFLRTVGGATAGLFAAGPVTAQSGGGETHTVTMATDRGSFYYDPVGLHVEPGDTVEWVNESGQHSATAYTQNNPRYDGSRRIPEAAESWDSGVFEEQGATFSYTFEEPGTYDYYCIPHKTLGMVGRIVCGSPGGPAEESALPESDTPRGVMPPSDTIVEEGSLEWPYVPTTNHGGPPMLFWSSVGVVGLTSAYLFSVYDRSSGRYEELDLPDDE
ncbi:plastocyanin/azurin family copper-binding protein [Haloplanus aerogenes]|uniref:Halocyanin n=1 Tax=Haloplanus aerogenes TaxID=660522 RepID=A0A3M0CV34_9EURY|nr:plastocyanin/azurin family copper-binding protein [Haloplanus aerogenes]AZH26575.1 halocyanin [Haloplanus aerogenes]RMB12805.1 plastocyanin [Haloplanus aerogenes]